MTEPADPTAAERRAAFVALVATLAIQVYASFATAAVPVLAPEIARDYDVSPRLVGVFVGIIYGGAMFGSLLGGGLSERYGAIRVSQVSVLLCAIGLATIVAIPKALLPLLVVSAVLLGFGYGPITPASSHVLIKTAPPDRMALIFSIKQTGVPGGAALAGAVLPGLALALGWHAAFLVTVVVGLVVAMAAQPTRRALDADRHRQRRLLTIQILQPVRLCLVNPRLRELVLIALVYAAMQMSLVAYLVVFLTTALGWSLVGAGFALTATTVGGVIGRVVWGFVADRLLPPRIVMGLVGLIAGACGAIVAFADASWPAALLVPVCTLFGMTAIGWNGVQLSELARAAPKGLAGTITGAAGFLSFSGVVAGPPIFATIATAAGSFQAAYGVFAVAVGLCGLLLLVHGRRAPIQDE